MEWESVKLGVGFCDVAYPVSFFRSTGYWHTGELPNSKRHQLCDGDLTDSAILDSANASIEILGDCNADLSIRKGGMVIIRGSLNGTLTMGGQAEVVIGGDLAGTIEGSGISSIFVGRSARGCVRHSASLSIWIEGNCSAEVVTGMPSTNLYIGGDFTGSIHPDGSDAALLYLSVGGYMSFNRLMQIAKFGYTEFRASIGRSDREPGYYPEPGGDDWVRLRIAHRPMWIIHSSIDAEANGSPGDRDSR